MKNFYCPGQIQQAGQDIKNCRDFYGHKFLLASEPHTQNSPPALSAEPAFCVPAVSNAAVSRGPLCIAGEIWPAKNRTTSQKGELVTELPLDTRANKEPKASAQLPLCYSTSLQHCLAAFYRQIAPMGRLLCRQLQYLHGVQTPFLTVALGRTTLPATTGLREELRRQQPQWTWALAISRLGEAASGLQFCHD